MKLELEKLDERQKLMQRKFGSQAFFLLAGLILINAFICELVYVWANPLASAMFMIYTAIFYYAIRTLFADALKGKIVSKWKLALFMVPFFVLGFTIGFIGSGEGQGLIEDGKLTMGAWNIFFFALLIAFGIAYLIKRSRDKRRRGDEE
jgi:apolipoprotein N-acyltransferase